MWALWRTGGCLPGSKDPIRRKCVQHSFFMAQSIRTFCTQEPLSGPWRASIQSVRFSRSVVSDTLQPHGLQDARLPCPSPTPGTCSNSCPLNQSIDGWMPPTRLVLCHLLLPLPSIPSIRVFSDESAIHIRWPKYQSFSFSIKSFQWIFRVDFL